MPRTAGLRRLPPSCVSATFPLSPGGRSASGGVRALRRGAIEPPADAPAQPRLTERGRSRDCFGMDQCVSEYETWADLRFYCVHSADPVGRLVLGLLRRADDAELVAASDDVCTGLQLVNFLQDVPRDLALGRIYLPAEDRRLFEVTNLDRPSGELRALLEFEAARARGLLL